MSKPVSRSEQLIAAMHYQALKALSQAPSGQLHRNALLAEIEKNTTLDDWAKTVYENGNTRWRSIFGFASVGLVKGGYVTKSKGGWSITDEGRAAIAKPYDGAAFVKEVRQRYRAWKNSQIISSPSTIDTVEDEEIEEAPKERIARLIKSAHESLAAELIESIKQCDPEFFEQLVVQLLIKMGYGGSRQEAGRAVGQSGDGGIDGVINEDRLGLDAIYLQAKRWEGAVGESPIRDFKGALDAKGAQKGVFITTSYFAPAAIAAAKNSRSYKIVLIDGARLANLMIEHNLGVSIEDTFQLKRIDTDFFNVD